MASQAASGAVIGSYRLLEQLGEGGMGTVWVAEHTLLGRRAAIKLLRETFSTSESIVQRFFNEAKAVAAIADPGIVQVFDFGVHGDGSPYIVMELLHGEALDARLRRVGRLAPPDAVRLVRQVALSLAAAHGKGVIHRDLKPENLFVVGDPAVPGGERVKVLDFGIAKLSRTDGKHKTRTGAVLGTPAYMSPEQCRAVGNIDHRSDIYSLGAVLFCLVTGRPPFEGEGAGDAIISHVRDLPPVPSSLAPGLSHGIDSVILRCLEKEPARRYQAMDELARALDGVDADPRGRAATTGAGGGGRPGTLGALAASAAPSQITTISDAPGEVAPGKRAARRRRWVSLALGAGAGLVVAVVIAAGGSDGPSESPPPAVPASAGSAAGGAPAGAEAAADEPVMEQTAPADAALADAAPPERVAAPADAALVEPAPIEPAPVEPAAPAAATAAPARTAPARPAPAPQPVQVQQVQKPRDKPRSKEGTTRHGADTKTSPGRPVRIDRGD
jgi:serine/threonine-protein kinase